MAPRLTPLLLALTACASEPAVPRLLHFGAEPAPGSLEEHYDWHRFELVNDSCFPLIVVAEADWRDGVLHGIPGALRQRLVGDQWSDDTEVILCASGFRPHRLAPGQSFRFREFVGTWQYPFRVGLQFELAHPGAMYPTTLFAWSETIEAVRAPRTATTRTSAARP